MEQQQFGTVVASASLGKEHIKFGFNLLDSIPKEVLALVSASSFVCITDQNIEKLYGNKIRAAFKTQGIDLLMYAIEPGESSKSRKTKEKIEDWMIERKCNRDTCILAFGGGVVGDLGGYVAATYMRGIPFFQIPTSLLAMVDSSIGGKTGVDTEAAKNLIGAFNHPKAVFIDLAFLQTLPSREFSNGMGEVIKTAAILDKKLFETLENSCDRILYERDLDVLKEVVMKTACLKAEIVSKDDKENGIRSILNFGHTIGHAIEALTFPNTLHGECVAIGMVLETKLSQRMGHLTSPFTIGRLIRCIQSYNLPIHIPKYLDIQQVIEKMYLDKKNANKKIRCTILKSIGDTIPEPVPVDIQTVKHVLLPSVTVVPSKVDGEIIVPGSKSISNRILLLCALAEGSVRIKGLLLADDTRVMLDALQQLGIKYEWENEGQVLLLHGSGGKQLRAPKKPLYLGNAGTASRFLTTACNIVPGKCVLTGTARLKERPIEDLTKALLANGCKIRFLEKNGCFPIEIEGPLFPGGKISLSANVSSQYVSSVLISAPYASSPVELQLSSDAVSKPFIDMTIDLVKEFGIPVQEKQEGHYTIPTGVYKNPPNFSIESDASSGSYPLAMAAITGGTVTVRNIGSKSIQGDSKFYTVLEKMGCKCEQTENYTKVTGPADGKLKAVNVDMNDMTDTFMTASVLCAVAEGTSRIYNIANQRVKESDRIAAMCDELSKLGVKCRELEDGLEIEGCAGEISKLHGAEIECYNDHRIAMSFAVLGLRVPDIIIKDKECVDKTYPEFWTDLENIFHVKVEVRELAQKKSHPKNASIILIGMRGSGKSTMGSVLAKTIQWKFIDVDVEIEKHIGKSIKEYVKETSWSSFREQEQNFLLKVTKENPTETIISTGGGVVETENLRKFLKSYNGPVIQLHRHIEDVTEYLDNDQNRANLGELPADIWKRRKPHYINFSNFEFYIRKGEKDWKATEEDLIKFVKKIIGEKTIDIPKTNEDGFFLSITLKNLHKLIESLPQISTGVNALELRVDLLESQEPEFIKDQIALLRRHTDLPIIYTVRTKDQGGSFVVTKEDTYFDLLNIGLRTGCEYIDLEACWSIEKRIKFLENKGISKVISSLHDFKSNTTESILKSMFEKVNFSQHVDILKIVSFAHQFEDSLLLNEVIAKLKTKTSLPIIAICAGSKIIYNNQKGEKGKLSRVLNRYMTPVTHPLLPVSAAPGQLSVSEILSIRTSLNMEPQPHMFYLFGSPISKSRSPLMHNTGFQYHNLPCRYELLDTISIEEVGKFIKNPRTYGGSVTIPHKQDVIQFVDTLSDAAKQIGAVNTIYKRNGKIFGDNTDWIAIFRLTKRALKLKKIEESLHSEKVALVVGAGGTALAACYAVKKLGLQLLVYNRTPEKAQELATRFGGKKIDNLESLKSIDIVIGTVPPSSNFRLPAHLIHKELIVVELVYFPRKTPLIQQAEEIGCFVIEGIELLFEQGVAAFEFFSEGRKAPRELIIENFLKSNNGELMHPSPPNFVTQDIEH